jgi:RNA polymerase sigma-70 factor, ECF subfamily
MSTAPSISQTLDDGDGWSSRGFRADLLTLVPQLRAFTRMLCGDRQKAENLAQDSLATAWRLRRSFQAETSLKAWLLTIARNQFYAAHRRAAREGGFDQDATERLSGHGVEPISSTELSDTLLALRRLPDSLREALLLVGPSGLSYEETARICGCQVATAKSRVSRARRMLVAILDGASTRENHRQRAG